MYMMHASVHFIPRKNIPIGMHMCCLYGKKKNTHTTKRRSLSMAWECLQNYLSQEPTGSVAERAVLDCRYSQSQWTQKMNLHLNPVLSWAFKNLSSAPSGKDKKLLIHSRTIALHGSAFLSSISLPSKLLCSVCPDTGIACSTVGVT